MSGPTAAARSKSAILFWRGLAHRKKTDPPVVLPGVWDGVSARLVASHGFEAGLVGGYHVGATVGSAEPLLTATELVETCRRIRRATDMPLRIDVGAGFGDPIHVAQLVRDLMQVGVEAISIEDQVFPKQAHYHNDYREQVIPIPRMVDKLRLARETGGDQLYLCARTDSFSVGGIDEVVERCTAYLAAGADAVQVFPPTLELATATPSRIPGPVWYANTRGNRVGRPVLTPVQARELGYVGLAEGHALFFAAYRAMMEAAKAFSPVDGLVARPDDIDVKRAIESALGLDRLYRIEAETILANRS
jgi:2-methylisocitrate lyase-like PEP mutase family enzyme